MMKMRREAELSKVFENCVILLIYGKPFNKNSQWENPHRDNLSFMLENVSSVFHYHAHYADEGK